MDITPKKILIVKPSSLGDIVHSLPFLHCLRKRFPEAELHWVVASGLHELLEGHPLIERLWVINKDRWKELSRAGETAREVKALFKELKTQKFDLVVDLQGLLRSGLITMATGAKTRIGFAEAREGSSLFYTHKVWGGKDIHAVERYLRMASALGCETDEAVFPLHASGSLPARIPSDDYAVLVPGARWKTKRWPAERFGELAALLPLPSVVVGSAGDRARAALVVERSSGKAISLAGGTGLGELAEVMRRARFVVSNDSGPLHIAAALGVPVFAIFGPTSARRTGPYGRGHTVIQSSLSCVPCFRKTCGDLRCMEAVTVQEVFRLLKAKGALAGKPTRP